MKLEDKKQITKLSKSYKKTLDNTKKLKKFLMEKQKSPNNYNG